MGKPHACSAITHHQEKSRWDALVIILPGQVCADEVLTCALDYGQLRVLQLVKKCRERDVQPHLGSQQQFL